MHTYISELFEKVQKYFLWEIAVMHLIYVNFTNYNLPYAK